MSLTFFWRAEGTTLDGTHDFTLGDTTASMINSGSISATAARIGSNGVLAPATFAGGAGFNLANDGIFPGTLSSPSDLVCAFGFSFYWATSVFASAGSVVGFKFQGTATNDHIQVLSTSGGANLTLRIRNSVNGFVDLTTSGGAITANAWFAVVCRVNFATNSRKIEIYNASGTLVDSAVDTSTSLSSYVPIDIKPTAGLILGQKPASHTNDAYFDNFFIADTYNEPIESNLTITSYTNYSTGTTPSWTAVPSMTSQTSSAYTVGFTANTACTIYGVAVIAGSTAPSIAQVKAGQNASGGTAKASNNKSVSGADTLVLTPSDSPAFPVYDLYFVLSNVAGDSSRQSLSSEFLDPPAGNSFTTLTSVDITSPFYGTGAAAGDTVVYDNTTDPDLYDVTCAVDGTVSYTSGGDDSRQLITVNVYDYSAGTYIGAGVLVFNNLPPDPVESEAFPLPLLFQKNVAIDSILLLNFAPDPEGDVVAATALTSLPPGLSITSSVLSGTPTTYGTTTSQIQWEDSYGATYVDSVTITIGDIVPDVVGSDQASAITTIESTAGMVVDLTSEYDVNVTAGRVISQTPTAGTLVVPGTSVSLVVSLGKLPGTIKSNMIDTGTGPYQVVALNGLSQLPAVDSSLLRYRTQRILNEQNSDYTLVLADEGKLIYRSSGAAAETITIPANDVVAFPVGTTITIINMDTNSVSIAIDTDTLYKDGTGSTGTRTLAQYGRAFLEKLTSTSWMISGSGIT